VKQDPACPPTALITTAGFKYVLEIGRHDIPRHGNLYGWSKPTRPITPERCFEVAERLDASGSVLRPLAEDEARAVAGRLAQLGIPSVAVVFLHAYANLAHERRMHAILNEEYPMSCIFGALAEANGGKVPAGSPVYVLYYFRAWDDEQRRPILCIEGLGVGLGARPFADGVDVIDYIAQENYPIEYVERDFPLRIERYTVRPDSGGPGFHRGGTGVVRDVRVLSERAELATRMENTLVAPYGVAGGRAGRRGRIVLNPDTPQARELPALGDGIVLTRGDLLRFETCRGGRLG
jgi:Hydantoinase B/oxoprolinase/Hydantoinase/oxoprolinase N-terminal region